MSDDPVVKSVEPKPEMFAHMNRSERRRLGKQYGFDIPPSPGGLIINPKRQQKKRLKALG